MLVFEHLFKYSPKVIIHSIGNRLLSHPSRIRKTGMGLSVSPDFKPGICSSGDNARAFFINPYLKERKESLQNHHADIVSVLRKWLDIVVSPTNQKEGLYTTSFPFYIEIVENIKSNDRFGEALSHVKSSKEYKKCSDLYAKMEMLENDHNQKVSEFMKETEEGFRSSIKNDAGISLEEQKEFNLPAISSLNLSQTPLPKEEFYTLVEWKYCGYNLSSIFNHLVEQRKDNRSIDVGSFENGLGWDFPKLFRRGAPLEIIAISFPAKGEKVRKLKILIDNIAPETSNKLGEFDINIQKARELLNGFQACIERIIHDEISLSLKGQCEKENRLRFRYVVADAIKSFRNQL